LKKVKNAIQTLYNVAGHEILKPATVQLYLNDNIEDEAAQAKSAEADEDRLLEKHQKHRRGKVSGRGKHQQQYLQQIRTNDLTIGVGPAGTGKTYLAVASAVEALENDLVDRLLLVRPAVEAGERLGFLPGDLAQKIDPYLRPMYDALFEMMGQQKVAKCIERNIIEIAPLAYMRGRTLNDSFIILDEAQNTTIDQMKMFLTRIGFGSKAVITGDITQVDLPRDKTSGLRHALKILTEIEGIGITHFHKGDIVRHPLVKKIVHAYEEDELR
jgi:phosphate starvation-inducible PhoH-like protein